jgi:hypothetical protein
VICYGEVFKFHLVSWFMVFSPISEGGLGIWNLRIFNRALLEKWLWRYVHEGETWWKLIVDAKYGGVWDRWCSLDLPWSHGVGLWKSIRKGWSLFCSHIRSRIRFWHDVWCEEMTLKEAFPVLYGITRDKDALAATHLVPESGSLQWDISFI